jgi:hypothetical protein
VPSCCDGHFSAEAALEAGPGARYQLQLMLDLFNVFNVNEVLSYSSNNVSLPASTAPSSIIPPRVIRTGARVKF